jgi:hypothetical protein
VEKMLEDRQGHMEELRRLVAKGEYAIDAEGVAARMVEEHLETAALKKELPLSESPIIRYPRKAVNHAE